MKTTRNFSSESFYFLVVKFSIYAFEQKKNNVYPCKPQFFYIKVGFKAIKIMQAYFRDVLFSPLG